MPTINIFLGRRTTLVATLALLLVGGAALWFLVFKPDGPPPDHMMDLLATSVDVNEARQLVEKHFKGTRRLDDADKLPLPPRSAKPETLESLEIKPGGNVVAKVWVRATRSDPSAVGGRVPVTLTWTPVASSSVDEVQWKCAGTPTSYLPQLCR